MAQSPRLHGVQPLPPSGRRQSALAVIPPLLIVAFLGLSTHFGRPATPPQVSGDDSAGETVMATLDAHLTPLCGIMLRNQYQTAMNVYNALQGPMTDAERVRAAKECLACLQLYNGLAARVPAEVFAQQGLPRQIPVPAWCLTEASR